LLIEAALAQSDEVTVVVYDVFVDEYNNRLMPAQKRANWITSLYPQLHNVVVLPDPLSGDYTEHDDPKYAKVYADQVKFLGPFTHVFSSEEYGVPFAHAIGMGTHPVIVDASRELMPISGTEIRSDLYRYRAFVDPSVYRSLIQKVVFVGTESTGKSTLTAALAEEFDTSSTDEYGRTLWTEKIDAGIKPTFHDLWKVGRTQYEQEQAAALHSDRFLFCDTNAWTTMLWSEMYYGTADARLYDLVERTKDDYIWFLCNPDFDWVQDGYRELEGDKAHKLHVAHRRKLREMGIDYQLLYGSREERMAAVATRLDVLVPA
jgi:HTH-type transcriptional repressor of NAD biosynthesis genes